MAIDANTAPVGLVFMVVVNQHGYLPETEPDYFETLDAAKMALIASIGVTADGYDPEIFDESLAEQYDEALAEVRSATGEVWVTLGSWNHSIELVAM